MVVLKNCEPELSYILADSFSIYLKESCFTDSWKVTPVIPVFKNVGKGARLKTTVLLNFYRLVDHLEKCGVFLVLSMVLGLLDLLLQI